MTATPFRCRSCDSVDTKQLLDYGALPIADKLLSADDLAQTDACYSLVLRFCGHCALVQIENVIPPEFLYQGDYTYFTSELPTLLAHYEASADRLIERRNLGAGHRVIEAASNDGYMLRRFKAGGLTVLGVDPAEAPARAAEARGVPTLREFFDHDLARRLLDDGITADVVIGNNVLNLIGDPNDFAAAAEALLAPGGVVMLEVPYVVPMCERGEFDLVYHQNTSYYSLTSLDRLFRRHGLTTTDVEPVLGLFGDSLRVFLERDGEVSEAVNRMLADEADKGADRAVFYDAFASRARTSRAELLGMLADMKRDGKRIVVYGAGGGAATTFLSFHDIDASIVDYAVDGNPRKHGRFTAGSRLEIHPPERLLEDQPDYVLLLARNYADEIVAAQREYRARGGQFITALPEPRVLTGTPSTEEG